jgi:SAM-dependent methyltransferase
MGSVDLDTFAWLRTPDGQRLLERAAATDDSLAGAQALRRDASPERAAAARTIVELRRHARPKWGDDAQRMWFTREALEQSTRARVAAHRAARLAAAQPSSVLDVGCGIGGDLIAFARAGLTVAGVDTDPLRVAMARANLESLGLPGAVSQADGTTLDTSPFGAVFADPARRSGAGRSFRADDWTPPWPWVEALLAGPTPSCAKVAPGIAHSLVPGGVEAEWVSEAGEVKEAGLWSPALATCRRRATVIGDAGLATLTDEDDAAASVRSVGDWLYEPDGAVIRAGLVTAVAAGVGGGLVDEHIAWVTADEAFRTPFARTYRVVDELPFREKQLRAALRERGIGRLAIKTRGVRVTPEQLRPRLALSGDAEGTLVLTRVAGQGTALLVAPL